MSDWSMRIEREVQGLRRLLGATLALASAARDPGWRMQAQAIPRRVRFLFLDPGCGPDLLRRVAAGETLAETDLRRLRARRRRLDPETEAAAETLRRRARAHGLRLTPDDHALLEGLAEDRGCISRTLEGISESLASGPVLDERGLRRDAAFLASRLEGLGPRVRDTEARLRTLAREAVEPRAAPFSRPEPLPADRSGGSRRALSGRSG